MFVSLAASSLLGLHHDSMMQRNAVSLPQEDTTPLPFPCHVHISPEPYAVNASTLAPTPNNPHNCSSEQADESW